MKKPKKIFMYLLSHLLFFSVFITILFTLVFIMVTPFLITDVDIPSPMGSIIILAYMLGSFVLSFKIIKPIEWGDTE